MHIPQYLQARLDRFFSLTVARAGTVLAVYALLVVGLTLFVAATFTVNTDLTEMVSPDLPFRQLKKQFEEAFPHQKNTIAVVVDGAAPEAVRAFQRHVYLALQGQPGLFQTVSAPGADEFFRQNGLLFRSQAELQSLLDAVSQAQAMLALAAREPSLPNLWDTLETFLERAGEFPQGQERLDAALGSVAKVAAASANGRPEYLSWQGLLSGHEAENPAKNRKFVLVSPVLDYSRVSPAKPALLAVKSAVENARRVLPGVNARITGNVALRAADMKSVSQGIEVGFIGSFVLVGVVLVVGLGSVVMSVVSLGTLLVGLLFTLAFAMAAIGSLNLISVAFIVLFVGLGIDYAIQYCLRFGEYLTQTAGDGLPRTKAQALRVASADLFPSLAVCSFTTAIGFFAFVPTAYVGASELGIISGAGMFILLGVTLTLLPALLAVLPVKPGKGAGLPLAVGVTRWPVRNVRKILAGAAVCLVAGVALSPMVGFDNNPLNLSDPGAEAVSTARELFQNPDTAPWNASLLTDSLEQAEQEAERLSTLPLVGRTVTLADFVPQGQEDKMWLIQDLGLVLPPMPQSLEPRAYDLPTEVNALAGFRSALGAYAVKTGEPGAKALQAAVDRILAAATADARGIQVLDDLRRGLLLPLAEQLSTLDTLSRAEPFGLRDLPPELARDYVSADGRYRVQVFPAGNIADEDAMRAFRDQLGQAAPGASGPPFAILGAGQVISHAFVQAVLLAVVSICVFLFLVLRNPAEVFLTLAPLIASMVYTLGLSVLLGLKFNFANIIVIPLILGIGIDYAVHLMYRYRVEAAGAENLLETSTARGVLFSALTTVLSFGSLCFSAHRGTASMGILLTLSGVIMITCTLVMLPALLNRLGPRLLPRVPGNT